MSWEVIIARNLHRAVHLQRKRSGCLREEVAQPRAVARHV